MRDHADVVVIGAGIMGLSIAYHLAEMGVTDVTVIDESYLCGGASGRNGGGVRAQWSSETNVRLMLESIRMCREFAAQDEDQRLVPPGRLPLSGAHADTARATGGERRAAERLRSAHAHALRRRRRSASCPSSTSTGVDAASYNPDDGVVFPWPFVWGYAQAAQKLGVEVATWHEVVGFETSGTRIDGVRVRRCGPPGAPASDGEATIRTNKVVNAAGAWSPQVARLLGVELPNKPHRHEICSTEPLKPWLKPLVADLSDGLYFSQSTRGEIVGGIGNEYVAPGSRPGERPRLPRASTRARSCARARCSRA